LKRTRGWRIPPNTVKVCRPTKWGNPFAVGKVMDNLLTVDNNHAVARYRYYLVNQFLNPNPLGQIAELRGKNLACFCKLSEPCHADVLLEIANKRIGGAP
jgi:hypothetical protein